MSRFFILANALTFGLAFAATAQAPQIAPAAALALTVPANERPVHQQAKAAKAALDLYPSPSKTTQPIHLSAWRHIPIFSVLDST